MPTEVVLIEQALHQYQDTQVLGDTSNDEYRIGQIFTLSQNAIITAVEYYFTLSFNAPVGQVTYRIETLSAGLPSGTLANTNAAISFTPTENSANKQTFSTPASISSGSYALVAECSNQDMDHRWTIGMDDNLYGGGTMVRKTNGTWASVAPAYDMTFRIYGYYPSTMGRIIMVL